MFKNTVEEKGKEEGRDLKLIDEVKRGGCRRLEEKALDKKHL